MNVPAAVRDGAPRQLQARARKKAAADRFADPEHRLAAGSAIAHGGDTRTQVDRELPDRGQREHLIRRLQLLLERAAIGKQRRMGVAIDQTRHDDVADGERRIGHAAKFLGAANGRDATVGELDDGVAQRRPTVAVDQQAGPQGPIILHRTIGYRGPG